MTVFHLDEAELPILVPIAFPDAVQDRVDFPGGLLEVVIVECRELAHLPELRNRTSTGFTRAAVHPLVLVEPGIFLGSLFRRFSFVGHRFLHLGIVLLDKLPSSFNQGVRLVAQWCQNHLATCKSFVSGRGMPALLRAGPARARRGLQRATPRSNRRRT